MRLESFRIHNCFGFVDSNEIDLSHEGNLIYFLGRNSSGKTSVLRAPSYLEVEEIPQQHPKFANYEVPAGPSVLRARFSIPSSGTWSLSSNTLVNGVMRLRRIRL